MQGRISRKIFALIIILFLLFISNLVTTVTFPWVGLTSFRFSFHILLIFFFSFYVKDDFLPIYVLLIELVHSLFTVQGWEIGTICGISLSFLIFFFKDLIHLSSAISIMLYSFIFFLVWYVVFALIYFSKIHSFDFFWSNLDIFLLESIFASVVAPVIFTFCNFLWGENKNESFSY